MFFLPAKDGFAANAHIQRQPYSDTIEAYNELSLSQFKNMNIEILQNRVEGNQVLYEYTGNHQGRSYHWYARAIKKEQHVYLATAIGLEKNWAEEKDQLMNAIDSFKLEI